jgi:hypothetical protein
MDLDSSTELLDINTPSSPEIPGTPLERANRQPSPYKMEEVQRIKSPANAAQPMNGDTEDLVPSGDDRTLVG